MAHGHWILSLDGIEAVVSQLTVDMEEEFLLYAVSTKGRDSTCGTPAGEG